MTDPLFAQPQGGIARVALPVPIHSLFDYRVPEDLTDEARLGCRVLVPFSGRLLTGVIVATDIQGEAPQDELSAIRRVLDAEPALSPDLIAILGEAAEEVLCPVGIALTAALPPGANPRVLRALTVTPRGKRAVEHGAVRGAAEGVLRELARCAATPRELAKRLGDSVASQSPIVDGLLSDGLATWTQLERGPSAQTRSHRIARVAEHVDVEAACTEALRRAPKQAALLRHLAESSGIQPAELNRSQPGSASLLRALEARGLIRIDREAAPRNVLGDPVEREARPSLTAEQAEALAPIEESIAERQAHSFLLHGVTGSGKTEVYLRAIDAALKSGRQALVLVPEITLTHQIVARLRSRFGDELAILHSGLRPGERLEQWRRLRRGETPIAVGARSALFAPLDDLGLIVLDEEHDSAYKNDEGFRYHARRVATLRARSAECPLILGSATPSLETRFAAERGEMRRLVLSRRIGGRPLPSVDVVDMTAERARSARGRKIILTRRLRTALAETLAEGAQSILFLNRRGFSTQIFCFECGFAERCVDCDVALVYHAAKGHLQCHYCDYSKPPPQTCGGCGAPDTALLGVGTERLEEEVRTFFPEARIARLDRDTAARRGHTEDVLRSLRTGEVDILIGTQMVAKGHDFPGVRTVGVIAADLGLHMPDFRAAERTFQLLTQVAGRAGRAGAPGHVVLQTFVPDHYAIRPVVRHDYETFYAEELQHRAALGFPPCGALAQLLVSAEEESVARATAARLAEEIRDASRAAGVEILGPAPSPIPRLRGRHRMQLLLKSKDAASLQIVAKQLSVAAARTPREVQAAVDVNPVNML